MFISRIFSFFCESCNNFSTQRVTFYSVSSGRPQERASLWPSLCSLDHPRSPHTTALLKSPWTDLENQDVSTHNSPEWLSKRALTNDSNSTDNDNIILHRYPPLCMTMFCMNSKVCFIWSTLSGAACFFVHESSVEAMSVSLIYRLCIISC